MAKTITFDAYLVDTLMPDLVGHDGQPSAFLVYLFLSSSRAAGDREASGELHADCPRHGSVAQRRPGGGHDAQTPAVDCRAPGIADRRSRILGVAAVAPLTIVERSPIGHNLRP